LKGILYLYKNFILITILAFNAQQTHSCQLEFGTNCQIKRCGAALHLSDSFNRLTRQTANNLSKIKWKKKVFALYLYFLFTGATNSVHLPKA